MVYQSFYVHEARKDQNLFQLDDVLGIDVLDEFEKWARSLPSDHFKNPTTQFYGTKPDVDRRNRLVFATMRTGHYGTAGDQVVNTSTHSPSFTTAEVDAQTVETRCGMLVPPGASKGLFFIEKQGFEGCGHHLLPSFNAHLKDLASQQTRRDGRPYNLVVKTDTVVAADAWLRQAQMEAVTGIVHHYSPDLADAMPLHPEEVLFSSTLQPVKGNSFLPSWYKQLVFNQKLGAAAYLGFPGEAPYDELVVKMGDGAQSKTMVIGREKTPGIRLLLNDHGKPTLSMSQLVDTIDIEAKNFYEREKLSYEYAWTRT